MVQLPETIQNAQYSNICEIGEERIRRAGKKIKEENPLTTTNLDIGFCVFKIDSSNMEDVYYRPADYNQGQMELFADNIKPDRTPEDYAVFRDSSMASDSVATNFEQIFETYSPRTQRKVL